MAWGVYVDLVETNVCNGTINYGIQSNEDRDCATNILAFIAYGYTA